MMTKWISSISRLIWDTDLIATRFLLALAEMLWAIMLLWPGETFSRPTYAHMAAIMVEQAWAVVFAGSAITQVTIILMNDYHSRFARYFARNQSPPVAGHQDSVGRDVRALQARRNDHFRKLVTLPRW